MRALIFVAAVTAVTADVAAQPLPGTSDDPAELLAIWPAVVDAPLRGFAVRGQTPADTLILVDGFEMPTLQHFGVRSIVPARMLADGALRTVPDVSIGRASTAVALELGRRAQGWEVESTLYDVALRAPHGGVRYSLPTLGDRTYVDGQV